MKMELTAHDYDYANYSEEPFTPVPPCNRDSDNNLGAQLSFLYYFMFVFSLFGNGLVLVIIHRFEKLTTVTNILLLNLVVSSLIFMSSLPFMGVYMQLSNWIFGKVMCKIVGSVYYLGFYSSVLFLTLLTFDRHLAVVYSMGVSRVRHRSYAVVSCAVVWLVSGLACVKQMILHTTFSFIDNKMYCQEYPGDLPFIDVKLLRASGFYLQLFLFLIFPLAVIIYCYVRITITVISSKIVTKFKTVRLIFIIVLLFFMCWTPFNIALLMHDEATTCEEARKIGYVLHVTRNIAYIYFCISPIFYTFVGKKFQNYFRQLLVKYFPGLKKHVSVNQNSRTNMSTKSTPNEL
ncbi:C-C chemokine receptor type 3-like [Siniperca chuatsi]|uniref:C-C chemokine receptor type 3-like n=1 Tax=Siniperca chuatsi TaxID=119488 RepID=UPI001CE02C8E|nr:C-C chemokine receptor type 3-like [Siniperca chuatsi]XP_044032697.1 C-C chemokine receptor type 3-like [Siniperca chuatsi]XP_044032698.1 C-C chemokine receptor type 3-like [Siniperca chuatsi]